MARTRGARQERNSQSFGSGRDYSTFVPHMKRKPAHETIMNGRCKETAYPSAANPTYNSPRHLTVCSCLEEVNARSLLAARTHLRALIRFKEIFRNVQAKFLRGVRRAHHACALAPLDEPSFLRRLRKTLAPGAPVAAVRRVRAAVRHWLHLWTCAASHATATPHRTKPTEIFRALAEGRCDGQSIRRDE